MSGHEDGSGGDEWDERHEKRKSWNPFARRGSRLSGAVDSTDVASSLRRQAKEEEERKQKEESSSRVSSRDRERRDREKADDAGRAKRTLTSSSSRGSSVRGESSSGSGIGSPAPSPGSSRGSTAERPTTERSGSGVSFRAMREEKAEHERKESEREERERRKLNLHDSDDDDDRVNGELRAARRSSVATTVDARRRKTSEKDVDALRAEKRRSERGSSRHKLDKPSTEEKAKVREEVEKKKRELERKKKEIEERIAKKKEEKERRDKSERGSERSERPERSERSERGERSERAEREEREREREARVRERERKDREEREEKERRDREEREREESEKQEREERERQREREDTERRERERREKEEREAREREERERRDKEEAERREREERERRAKETRDKDAERSDDDRLKKTVASKRVPLERKESMVDSWAKKQMALLKEKKEREKEKKDRESQDLARDNGARDSTSESEESSDEVSLRPTTSSDRIASPSTSSDRMPSTPTSPTAASAAAAAAALSGLTSSASMVSTTKDKKKLERERKEIERKEKKKLEKEMKEKAKEEKRKEREKEKAERAKKGKDKEKKAVSGLASTKPDQDDLPHTGSQQIIKKAAPNAAASGGASTTVLKQPPTVGRSRGKGPSTRPSLLDSALSTAMLPGQGGSGNGGGAPKITRSAEEKSRMLGTHLIQMSVPNIKRKGPTFIPGFNPFPTNGPRYQQTAAAPAAAAPVAVPATNGDAEKKDVSKDAKGFARALLDFDRPKANPNLLLTRQTGWGRDARGTIREVPASRRGQLQSMKADRFWFSTINFAKARDEGVVKAKVDSLETQLSLKWDDFIASLPAVSRPGHKKVRDGYDAAGVEKLENQGAAIVSALKLTAGTARGAEAKGVPEQGKKEVALPSYLRDFTGDEDDSDVKKKHEDTRAKKYAVDMFLTANPNIAKDAAYDELFGECASEDPGLYIWRVEYFIPLEIDDEDYPDLKCKPPRPARFFSEDCYVILHITSMEKAKKFTIFTWMGAKSTVDKQGAAAFRSRELNIFLNSKAMIVRESQYDESDDFMELFGWQIDYQDDGGTESAFKPTLPFSQEPRFYRLAFAPVPEPSADDPDAPPPSSNAAVVGKRRLRYFSMRQVRLSALSLNSTDVFVLDGGTDGYIFQWNGSRSERALQFKGHEICTRINRYERSCGSKIRVLEEGFEDAGREEDGPEWRNFWDYMREPLEGPVPERGPEVVDDILLCKTAVDPATGRPRLVVIRKGGETGPLSRRMLHPSAAVIMDAFTELFVWIGHESSLLQRQIAKAAARRFRDEVNKEGRPSWTPINIIYENFEPSAFIAKFPDWCAELFAPLPSNYATAQMSYYSIAPSEPWPKISIDNVVNLRKPPQEPFVDEGGGSVEVWAIEDGKPTFTKLPAEERGHFYSGDCYLVLYTFYNPNDNMKQAYLCYFWEGRSSSNRWWPAFLFGFYPVLEKKILNYGGRPPVKIRIMEHKEPPHFMKLFNGHIIIHKGHRKKRLTKPKSKALYHIRRTTEEITHTVQVKAVVSSLNSKDAFVLLTQDYLYLWYGKGTGFEDSTAILKVPDLLQGKRTLEVFDEGEEVPAFWNLLGGWSDYVCNQQFLQKYREKARLFCFSNQTGRLEVSEVYEYFQTDLNLANVYLLDTYHEVYVWLGKSASESQYKQVLEFANRYVREMATRRKIYVPLIATEDGEEQVEFTRHFHTWVTKPPFIDPAIGRDDRYADLMFQVYKKKEQEKAMEKELRLAQSRTKEPLRKIDWIEWIRKEIPELILNEGEFSDEEDDGEEGEYYDEEDEEEEEITFDQVGERGEGEEDNSEEEESSESDEPAEEEDEEIVYGEFDAGEIEEKPKAVGKTAAEYLMEKVHKESKYFKMYHT